MLGLYFSGTGNTKHCVKEFVRHCDAKGETISIEDSRAFRAIEIHNQIVLGYPVYYSNAPRIVQEFIKRNAFRFRGKQVFVIATMGLFSGDGTGCTARCLKRHGARILGGLHLKMPDCIGDEKALKKPLAENRKLVAAAEIKMEKAAKRLLNGKAPQEGLGFFSHLAGLFGQRLWFYGKTASYKRKPRVSREKCTGCARCVRLCPMFNLEVHGGKAVPGHRCTLCYRCFSHCPSQALTILGKQVHEQPLFEKYCADSTGDDASAENGTSTGNGEADVLS